MPKDLTSEQLMEFANVLIYKVKNLDVLLPSDRDELTAIIQLVVMDTWLMMTDRVPLDEWMKEPVV